MITGQQGPEKQQGSPRIQAAKGSGMPGENPNTRFAVSAGIFRSGSAIGGAWGAGRTIWHVCAAGNISRQPERGIYRFLRDAAKGTASLAALAVLFSSSWPTSSWASELALLLPDFGIFDRTTVLLMAVFGGAMSFAMLSAFWLIRERARIGGENHKLQQSFASMRADRDRLSALVDAGDQRIAVWEGEGKQAKVLGRIDAESGAPQGSGDFLAFGKWLTPTSASDIENAVSALRTNASQFTINLKTLQGTSIEAQGRVSGGHAFVRFILLEGARNQIATMKRKHETLLARFGLLESLFEKIPAPVWIRSVDGKLAYVNSAYAKAVEAEDTDQAVNENKSLFDRGERETIQRELESRSYFHGKLPAVFAGDRRTFETISVLERAGKAGIAIDRSDVEAVQATLRHAMASHEQTFDHLGSAVAIFDAKQRLQFRNSSFQQLWGLSEAELDGNPPNSELLETLRNLKKLPEMPDWKKWKEAQLASYHATETREDHWHLPDGRTLRVIVNPQNQGGTSWVFENVTEELELKSSYNSLMRVQGETLDHLNEAVAVFGSDGRVKLTNPAFLALWKFDDAVGIEGEHVKQLSGKICAQLVDSDLWNTIHLGITGMDDDRADIAGRLDFKSGAIFDYHLVYLPEGQSMLTLTDMTATVNVERALKDRNDALEESDALKTRFIQHVSYELRAPLTSIAGFAEILSGDIPGKLNAKQAEYLEYISRSSDVLKALIDDILDLATIDAGAMQLDLGRLDIGKTIQESLEAAAEKIDRYKLRTKVQIDPKMPQIIGDERRLRQIIFNLVSNAAGVSPDGGLIEISARMDGGEFELAVCDQGPGVPEEKRDRIFERFETGKAKDHRHGAGLGLSIVKSFVELHGGRVYVEPAGKRGARFVCRIPAKPSDNLQAAE
jgi:signal transduction histidine kinase/PAS domain-containing protein